MHAFLEDKTDFGYKKNNILLWKSWTHIEHIVEREWHDYAITQQQKLPANVHINYNI